MLRIPARLHNRQLNLELLAVVFRSLLEYIRSVMQRGEDRELSEAPVKSTTGLQPNVAALLSYVLGWITGLIFLVLENNKEYVRFHAMQSIVVFGAITVVDIVLRFIPVVGGILSWIIGALAFVLWIVLMVKAYQGQRFKLPVAGDIAEAYAKKTPPQSPTPPQP